jgi:hypothetical protein
MTEGEGFAWTTRDGVGVDIQLYTKHPNAAPTLILLYIQF